MIDLSIKILWGILSCATPSDAKKYTEQSDDDPAVINTIMQVANEMGLNLKV